MMVMDLMTIVLYLPLVLPDLMAVLPDLVTVV